MAECMFCVVSRTLIGGRRSCAAELNYRLKPASGCTHAYCARVRDTLDLYLFTIIFIFGVHQFFSVILEAWAGDSIYSRLLLFLGYIIF